jgi:ubiquinone/menaquinone biosynthesis C-methylase UbiE
VLDVQPGDTVLEVGGGTGVSAGLICSRLDGGRLIALDRSAKATARTVERNRDHVAEGRLEAVTGALAELTKLTGQAGQAGSMDRALAVNVNVFWTGSADAELEVLRRVLRPGGLVVLVWGAGGPQSASRIVAPTADGLLRHGFTSVAAIYDRHLVGVTARAPF